MTDAATKKWALQIANSPQSALTKAEREHFRRIAAMGQESAIEIAALQKRVDNLRYNAGLYYLDDKTALARDANKRADTLTRMIRRITVKRP
jgi:hypothetical protein